MIGKVLEFILKFTRYEKEKLIFSGNNNRESRRKELEKTRNDKNI